MYVRGFWRTPNFFKINQLFDENFSPMPMRRKNYVLDVFKSGKRHRPWPLALAELSGINAEATFKFKNFSLLI